MAINAFLNPLAVPSMACLLTVVFTRLSSSYRALLGISQAGAPNSPINQSIHIILMQLYQALRSLQQY
jgi:hypothetical protein